MDQSVQLPWNIKAIIFAGAALTAAGAGWIGVDLGSEEQWNGKPW